VRMERRSPRQRESDAGEDGAEEIGGATGAVPEGHGRNRVAREEGHVCCDRTRDHLIMGCSRDDRWRVALGRAAGMLT
jgi:hypothetical protein